MEHAAADRGRPDPLDLSGDRLWPVCCLESTDGDRLLGPDHRSGGVEPSHLLAGDHPAFLGEWQGLPDRRPDYAGHQLVTPLLPDRRYRPAYDPAHTDLYDRLYGRISADHALQPDGRAVGGLHPDGQGQGIKHLPDPEGSCTEECHAAHRNDRCHQPGLHSGGCDPD